MGERRPQTAKIAANQTGQPTGDLHRVRYRLRSAVGVVVADNIVFAEIGARLHLDEMQRDLAGIFKPVPGAHGNEGQFILVQRHLLVAFGHLGGAGDDDPMLGAVMMHLQREDAAGLHHDVLHLDALAIVDRAISAPGPMHERVRDELAAIAALQPGDKLLDVLRAIAARDHDRVRGRDDDEILDAEHGEQA